MTADIAAGRERDLLMERAFAPRHESRVLAAVLRRMLHGEPVSPVTVGMVTGLAPEEVEAALASLDAVGALHRRDGQVVAAYPLSGIPTRHRIRVGRATARANCAVDALAVPFMVDHPVMIESTCPHCDGPITVRMSGGRDVAPQPDAPVVYVVSDACGEPGPAVLTRCPHINFFCSVGDAAAWQRVHSDLRGTVLTLDDAIARARERFTPVIRAFRGHDVPLAALARRFSG